MDKFEVTTGDDLKLVHYKSYINFNFGRVVDDMDSLSGCPLSLNAPLNKTPLANQIHINLVQCKWTSRSELGLIVGVVTPSPFGFQLMGKFHMTSDPEEFSVQKFSRLFFHLAPNEIHPLALLIPVVLFFSCVFCIVIAMKFSYYSPYITHEYKLVNPFFNFHSPCLPH